MASKGCIYGSQIPREFALPMNVQNRGEYAIQGTTKCPSLEMLETHMDNVPHNPTVNPVMTSKDPFQPTSPYDIEGLGQREVSTKPFAAICFCFLDFGFSTCLTL